MSIAEVQKRYPLETREQAYKLYAEGKRNVEIASELGVAYNTLIKWSSEGKWAHRLSDQRAGVTNKRARAAGREICLRRGDAQTFEEKQDTYRDAMATQALRIAEVISEMPKEMLVMNADRVAKLDTTGRKALNLEQSKATTVIQVAFLQQQTEQRSQSVIALTSNVLPTREIEEGSLPVLLPDSQDITRDI